MKKLAISFLLMIPAIALFQCVELSVSGWPTSEFILDSMNVYVDTGNGQFAKTQYSPAFDSVTYYYTADVNDSIIRIQPFSPGNHIDVDNRHTPSEYWSNDIGLSYGLNTIKIRVSKTSNERFGPNSTLYVLEMTRH
jgi:hypothetical protein